MEGPYVALGKNAAADRTFAKIGWPMLLGRGRYFYHPAYRHNQQREKYLVPISYSLQEV
jgi:hypothetical protein